MLIHYLQQWLGDFIIIFWDKSFQHCIWKDWWLVNKLEFLSPLFWFLQFKFLYKSIDTTSNTKHPLLKKITTIFEKFSICREPIGYNRGSFYYAPGFTHFLPIIQMTLFLSDHFLLIVNIQSMVIDQLFIISESYMIQGHIRTSTQMSREYQSARWHSSITHANYWFTEINSSITINCWDNKMNERVTETDT